MHYVFQLNILIRIMHCWSIYSKENTDETWTILYTFWGQYIYALMFSEIISAILVTNTRLQVRRLATAAPTLYVGRFINTLPWVPSEFGTHPYPPLPLTYFYRLSIHKRDPAIPVYITNPICSSSDTPAVGSLPLSTQPHPQTQSPLRLCVAAGGWQAGADPGVHWQSQLHEGRPTGEERCAGQRGASFPTHPAPQGAREVLSALPAENAGRFLIHFGFSVVCFLSLCCVYCWATFLVCLSCYCFLLV